MVNKLRLALGLLAALATLALAAAAQGATPTAATSKSFEVTLVYTDRFNPPLTFTATGLPGCKRGMVDVESFDVYDIGRWRYFELTRTFSCIAGAGSFTLRIVARVEIDGCPASTTGTWEVVGGTGSFATLTGKGTILTEYGSGNRCGDNDFYMDTYSGKMSLT